MQGPAHPYTLSPKDWEAFRREYSPARFSQVLDRGAVNLPDWFLPSARGAVVPGGALLRDLSQHRNRPAYWHKLRPEIFRANVGALHLTVNRFGNLWAILGWGKGPEALTFHCGSTPVLLCSHREAMWLSQYPYTELDNWGYRWTPILPTSAHALRAQALAEYTDGVEAADRLYWRRRRSRGSRVRLIGAP
jgi:hypothetical protein